VPRIGAVACGLSTATIVEVYELRAEIEAWICRRSVPRLGAAETAELGRLLDEMATAKAAEEWDKFFDLGWRFRETLYSGSTNATAMEVVRSLRARLHTLPQVLRTDPEHIELTMRTYPRLAEAAGRGDAGAVAGLIDEFMIACGDRVVGHFSSTAPVPYPPELRGNPD
jgi:DNA-binding GntR family transcriptional regulator